jgi:hypothetical protein
MGKYVGGRNVTAREGIYPWDFFPCPQYSFLIQSEIPVSRFLGTIADMSICRRQIHILKKSKITPPNL